MLLKLRLKILRLYARWQDWREGNERPFDQWPDAGEYQRIIGRTRTTIRRYSPFKGAAKYWVEGGLVHYSVDMQSRNVYWPVHSMTIPPERWVRVPCEKTSHKPDGCE